MENYENWKNFINQLFNRYYLIDYNFDEFVDEEIFHKALIFFETDYERYYPDAIVSIDKVVSRLELVGILLYRLARTYFLARDEITANHLSNLGRIVSGFEIYYSADIGKGLKINHGLGTVIGARCVIGDNALIHQGVTLGDRNGARPTLLNNVSVYAGAKILGRVVCGNQSVIAANCVCITDVPDNAVMIGIPGKIKK